MIKNILILFVVIFNLYACESTPRKTNNANTSKALAPDSLNAENSIDWDGTYQGFLPCASCVGILTTIELNNDNTFLKRDLYLSNKDTTFTETGTFSFQPNSANIILKSGVRDSSIYRVEQGSILMLNSKGEESESPFADMYRLAKMSDEDVEFTNEAITGLVTIGHEVSVFQVLGSSRVYWITDLPNGELNKIFKEKIGAESAPYTPLIAKLVVRYKGEAIEGFAEQYDGIIELVEIKYVEEITPDNFTAK